ncbi:MAG TPA: type III pantothenate kinase, partial [Gemmatimonadaceae bacterium]|nr:type III pantothenate kinase [Gemmatimonadaceae bacterium]
MILVFDVGNTETTVGLFDGTELRGHWRLSTAPARTADELGLLLRGLVHAAGCEPAQVRGAAIGSVVPAITPALVEACHVYFETTPVVVDARAPLPIRLDVDEPLTVGADRLINTLAASRLYGRDVIV